MNLNTLRTCVFLFTYTLLPLQLPAAEYFVAPGGDDSNSGLSQTQAFATVQHGVNALAPGDVLTIAAGEYRESVFRDGLGSAEAQTLIRAAQPGTAILRGDLPVAGFSPVPGYERVYVTQWTGPVESVNEIDSRLQLRPQFAVDELEVSPGSFFHDAKNELLYISTTDFAPPDMHELTVSVDANHGMFFDNPQRVVIEGLVLRGFNSREQASWTPGAHCYWGLILRNAIDCIIRDCTAFANGGGIAGRTQEGHGNVIENCIAYGNSSAHSAEGGNIIFFSPRDDTIRNCLSFKAGGDGIRLYGAMLDLEADEGSAIEGCVAWGNRGTDIFVKGGGVADLAMTRNSVARDIGHAKNIENVFIGGINQYLRHVDAPANSVYQQHEQLDEAAEFADPYNHDFRLQATSTLRGSGPDGGDRGPYPYAGDVYFVNPDGNDSASGTSTTEAWRTVAHALLQLGPGDTLYIEEGTYPAPQLSGIGGAPSNPLRIRGRGRDTVIFEGRTALNDAAGVTFERIQFDGGVTLTDSRRVQLANCRLYNAATGLSLHGSEDIRLDHCQLTDASEAGITISGSSGLVLTNNLFDNHTAPALQLENGRFSTVLNHSDHNGFTTTTTVAADSDGQLYDVDQWQAKGYDRYSSIADTGFTTQGGVPLPTAANLLTGRSAHGSNLGVHHEPRGKLMAMSEPQVTSVSSTTANIEWVLTGYAYCDVAWGTTPECENEDSAINPYNNNDTLYSFSLTELEPDTTYYFRVKRVFLPHHQLQRGHDAPELAKERFDVISFTTAATDPDPVTYYVSTQGDNHANGLSPDTAWASIRQAAQRARPGDTVIIGGGDYFEQVRLRVTGAPDKPITFRAAAGEEPVLNGMRRQLDRAILASSKNHLRIEGLEITGYALTFWHTGAISLVQCDDIQITHCVYDGRGAGYPCAFLNAYNSGNLLIADCIIASGIFGLEVRNGYGEIIIENNVFMRNMIEGTKLGITQSGMAYVRNNIFTDSMPDKVRVNYHWWGGYERIVDDNNLYVLRVPDEERKVFRLGNYRGPKDAIDPDANPQVWTGGVAAYNKEVAPTTSMAVHDAKFTSLQSEALQEALQRMIENRTVASRTHYAPDLFSNQNFPSLRPEHFQSSDPIIQARGFGPRKR